MSPVSTQTDVLIAEPRRRRVPYVMPHASKSPREIKRLNDMHNGFKDFLDHRLSFAPLHEYEPKQILELGTGSGAWAMQAANEFPQAEVLAVDLAPPPIQSISVPLNMKFQTLNLLDPLPFEPESFDLIHERFVFMHLPGPEKIISRVISLVKPGGWLLMEDMYENMRDQRGLDVGPATNVFFDTFHRTMRSRGVDSTIPISDNVLRASGLFSEINVKTIAIPISEQTNDPKWNRLGARIRSTFCLVALHFAEQGTFGFTHELAREFKEELEDRSRQIYIETTFMWSRKHI